MKTIQLAHTQDEGYIEQLVERCIQPDQEDYDLLVEDTATVLRPNGEVLFKLLRTAIPLEYVEAAWEAFHDKLDPKTQSYRKAIANSANEGSEGVLGYMDRVHRLNYCRTTALAKDHLEEYKAAIPMIRAVGDIFAKHMPERYAAQHEFCQTVRPEYLIPETPFSTVTLNRDVSAVYHTDKGDLKAGFGIIAATWARKIEGGWEVVTENSAEGGLLVFPKCRVAVKIRTGDVLLCDVHEVHGVTQIVGEPGSWARLSSVYYCREHMNVCGAPSDEIERVSVADTEKYFGMTTDSVSTAV